ncbi:sodium-dependent transporter [Marinomonas sp. 15G1-11]|uniref:Transporter n=1 Tax=Marinomonas phaeophyticola TaxID=3004091 RepID=A0ABT4JUU3_9GAMM|nr:sodium-dependent transporter [Marinomonas sp. 15G1-11]MCZ2722172.1 sodium-dependent transporter [Marinomonas sp. 15G1-11]
MPENRCVQGIWSSPWLFILAASGSAVGLGNIWKFPYMVGENGGGAFLFVYLLCLLFVGLPVLIAEVALGRSVRANPIDTINDLHERRIIKKAWVFVPYLAGLAGFLILSFYSVIAGWALAFFERSLKGVFVGTDEYKTQSIFKGLIESPAEMLLWHSVFVVLVILAVGQSVTKGLAVLVKVLLPVLILMLIGLSIYSSLVGDVEQTLIFLFSWNWNQITPNVVLSAVGHAFFSLSIGMGGMFAYAAYMSKHMSIARACTIVVGIDSLVAILAGLVVLPLVFSLNIAIDSGPSLTFVSLPVAFGSLPGGQLVGAVFFLLLILAALTSAISMLELFVSWLHERFYVGRFKAALLLGIGVWFLGLVSLLSLNDWGDWTIFGYVFFDALDKFTSLILLPIVAILLSVLVALNLPRSMLENELITRNPKHFKWWYNVLKFFSIPIMLVITIIGWIGV